MTRPRDLRPSRSAGPHSGICAECGCTWFRLRRDDGEEGGVAVDADGNITAYHGNMACRDCGALWLPGDSRLRSVE